MFFAGPVQMNEEPVQIRRLLDTRRKDNVLKEPTGKKKYSPPPGSPAEVLQAQVTSFKRTRRVRTMTGNMRKADGYILYRTPADPAQLLKNGDLIVGMLMGPDPSYGTDATVYEIIDNVPWVHVPGPSVYCAMYQENSDALTGRPA